MSEQPTDLPPDLFADVPDDVPRGVSVEPEDAGHEDREA